jgi:hypothetical protein
MDLSTSAKPIVQKIGSAPAITKPSTLDAISDLRQNLLLPGPLSLEEENASLKEENSKLKEKNTLLWKIISSLRATHKSDYHRT